MIHAVEEQPLTVRAQNQYSPDSVAVSPLSLYSTGSQLDIELRPPHDMSGYHWHSQVEVNIPFGGDVEYLVNNKPFVLKEQHIGLFWAAVPHRLTHAGNSRNMAIINVPINLFLSWPISRDLLNQITNGDVIQSANSSLVSEFEVVRWEKEMAMTELGRQQLVIDEVCLMLKRVSLDGWDRLLETNNKKTNTQGVSQQAQAHVQQMLEYIAHHQNSQLTIKQIAGHVGLHANYAMGLFQRVMQQSIKQYITSMRINHARALLSDSDRTILDIALTVGFNSSSRFYETFQKHTGVTPGEYRTMSREDSRWCPEASGLPNYDQGACDGRKPLVTGVNHSVR